MLTWPVSIITKSMTNMPFIICTSTMFLTAYTASFAISFTIGDCD